MNKAIKKGGSVGSLENARYMETPWMLSKVKLQARALAHALHLQDYCWPGDLQKAVDHAQHSNAMLGNDTVLQT